MVANPFIPENLVGRQAERYQIIQVLAADGDLLVAGVPGSGRRTLIRYAAHDVGAKVIEIDCLRATDSRRFLHLLAEGILFCFETPAELALIQRWSTHQPIVLEESASGQARLVWHAASIDEWQLLQTLLALPQVMAEWLNSRIVIVFQNFTHIRSWDRSEKWENYLRQEIQQQSRVSYALITTVTENWMQQSDMQVVFLGPLKNEDLQSWLIEAMATHGLKFEPQALELFLNYVQGSFGDAIALARRLWLDHQAFENFRFQIADFGLGKPEDDPFGKTSPDEQVQSKIQNLKSKIGLIQAHQVHRSTLALIEDLSLTFESLLLLLPPSQVRVLESLALDPTDSPHSREYIQKHHLSRGGGLQGALASLQQKGLVYGPEHGYRITMPLLAFWLKHRLT
ncbi:MAG: ATP-binding protein [Leptolyngbyaceae cyanobacterium RU_5_1]|nr:ATP-binding protein [Leptolyngbyaceae cyanobacterium RU_5_1]